MSSHLKYILPLILAFAANGLAAETQDSAKPFDPAARVKAVAPVIDEMTKVVVHVDLERLQVGPMTAVLERIIPPQAFDAQKLRDDLLALRSIFLKAGFDEFYVVASLEDMPSVPYFIVAPLPQDGRSLEGITKELTNWYETSGRHGIAGQHNLTLDRLGDLAFIGSPQALERLRKLKPAARPKLAQAFAAAADTDVQIVLLASDDDRRVVEELYPTLPKWLGGGPSTVVTHGLRWAAIGMAFPPEPQLRMTIESKDNEAAKAFNSKISEVLPLIASGNIFAKKSDTQPLAADALKLAALIKPTVNGRRIECTLGGKSEEADALVKILAVPLAESMEIIWRRQTVQTLKQLGLAMHNHHDTRKSFPAQANCDAQGRPLLSWRVLILPWIGENNLYRKFHLDEPWDSPHNRKLIEKMPKIFAMPNSPAQKQNRTCFVRPVGENTVCPGKQAIRIKDITDGTPNTIMIVEADEEHAVIWTKPDDIVVDPKQPAKGLGGHFKEGFLTTFCDGAVHFIPSTIDQQILNALFSRNGGEVIDHGKW